jgi:hypothetical protein
MVELVYALEPTLTAEEFQAVLIASTLAARRPADDLARLDKMLRNAQIIVTARHNGRLVGISRAITDFAFCCYLSDLAVDQAFQHRQKTYRRHPSGRRASHQPVFGGGAGSRNLLPENRHDGLSLFRHSPRVLT